MKEKLKSFLADDSIYMASIVVGVGVSAFLLGRLSVISITSQDLQIVDPLSLCPTTLCAVPINDLQIPIETSIMQAQIAKPVSIETDTLPYVASKAGTKYHHITCSGAKQIKEENKIYFADVQQAQAAGYTKAANCDK